MLPRLFQEPTDEPPTVTWLCSCAVFCAFREGSKPGEKTERTMRGSEPDRKMLTLSFPSAAKYDLIDFNVLHLKTFIKVAYVRFLHNQTCISWKPYLFLSSQW